MYTPADLINHAALTTLTEAVSALPDNSHAMHLLVELEMELFEPGVVEEIDALLARG